MASRELVLTATTPASCAGVIEPLKWLALVVMLAEHWMRYVVGDLPQWLFNFGRVVFPLFAFALAAGLSLQPRSKLAPTMVRAFAWAVVAQVTIQLVDAPAGRLNVLFTFGLGLAAAHAMGCGRSPFWLAILLSAIGAAALRCEFGPVGVALVAGSVLLARKDDPPFTGWLAIAALLIALAVPNGNHWALAALPVTFLLWILGPKLPRIRGAFYWAYALQFPFFAGVRMLLS